MERPPVRRRPLYFWDLLDGRQLLGDGYSGIAASRVPPAAGADAQGQAGRSGDVVDDIVGPARVGAHTPGHEVEIEVMTGAPGDVVVGAGRISADAEAANEEALRVVEGEASAKDV